MNEDLAISIEELRRSIDQLTKAIGDIAYALNEIYEFIVQKEVEDYENQGQA